MFRKLLHSSQPILLDELRPGEDPTISCDLEINSSHRYLQTKPH